MITSNLQSNRLRRRVRLTTFCVATVSVFALLSGQVTQAKPIPSNLGNGLDKLVVSDMAVTKAKASGVRLKNSVTVNNKVYTDEVAAAVAQNSLSDSQGRLLVRVTLNGSATLAETEQTMAAVAPSLTITAVDNTYRGVGVMNAYVDVADVPALANARGVSAVILEWKPRHAKAITTGPVAAPQPGATIGEVLNKVGTAFDQGVTQHRVDQINKLYNPSASSDFEGQGMQIGCISNSYASHSNAGANGPQVDVANGDLPGTGNPMGDTTPVFILQDDTGAEGSVDDEGRAMVQITHKMAPKAALAFATADGGEVGFANNIRGLAGIPGYTVSGQTFAADTICDDVGYFDEPFFQDGIIGNGVDDASAAGVCYFSSAANDIGTNGYDSDTRWIANGTGLTAAAGNTALTGTNIDLTGVPTNLYAGGFHNFNPAGQDIAQTVNIASNTNEPETVLQWNDPYDQTTAPNYTATLFSGNGTYTSAPVLFTISATVTQGTLYEVQETASSGSTFDGIVTVYRSDGTTVIAGPQDTGTDETVRFFAPVNDSGFVIKVDHFGTTTGAFSLLVRSASGFSGAQISTSLSLLVFNLTTGAYISSSSLTTNAFATNQPIQLGFTFRPTGSTQVQYVIARSVVPSNPAFPTHLRYLIPGNGLGGVGPAEYFTYNTVTTGGHAMASTCNGSAAYSVFRPSLPETFTSPGPVMIYYDKMNNRLSTPEVRLQPRIAAADGANISANMAYFAGDNGSDPDTTQGQFFGTSAAGPHAAAIGALVLQSHGGRRSVTPAQMTNLLQRSTFPHDLDPNFASGTARITGGSTGSGKVTITVSSDGSVASAAGTTKTGGNDVNSFTVSYVGASNITSLVFNPQGTAATGGNPTGGNNGVTYNAPDATVGGTVNYFENSLPGVAFLPSSKAFTPGSGIVSTAAFTNLSSGTNQYYTMTVTPSTSFTSGNLLHFTVGRGLARANTVGAVYNAVTNATAGSAYYSADIFGGNVSIPNGTTATATTGVGMTFSGTTADGGTFSGTLNNRIGSGYSVTDGYGFINAEAAVVAPIQ